MRTLKKICCILLMLSMLLSASPAPVHAVQLPENLLSVSPQHTYETAFGKLSCRRTLWPRSTSEESYLTDIAETAAVLREGMKQRKDSVTVLHQCASNVDFDLRASAIFYEAIAHTGVPTEGDYLGKQLGSMACSGSYYVLDGVAYYTMTYTLRYFTTAEQEAEMDVAVQELLDFLDLYDATDYEKLRGVYDWICEYVDYDYANLNDSTYLLKHSAYAALTRKTAVCQGIALLLYRLLLELGVDSRYISGYGEDERHGWNIVRLDGVYYNVDATWDLGITTFYRYFLCTDENFPNHTRDPEYTTAAFMNEYPMATTSYVVNVAASGTLNNSVKWVLDGDTGMLTISGTGAMPDFKNLGAPWYVYAENIAGITIGEGITSVGDYSFVRCKNATVATLPSTLTRIGQYGFDNCRSLVEITLPSGLKVLGNNAFSECTRLKELTIPGSVISIGSSICSNSMGLKKITLGEGITTIPNSLCFNCDGLKEVVLPSTVTRISDTAFRECDAMQTFHIPASITSVGYGVLSDCNSLTSITVDANNPSFTSVGGVLFSKDLKTLCCWPAGRSGAYSIPEGTVTIASAAFSDAGKLTSITFPNSLITINDYAFAWCSGLKEVKLSDSVEYLGDFAFGQCPNIKRATLSKNLKYFDNAFYFYNYPYTGCALEEIIFTGNAPTFDTYAFNSTVATVYYPQGNETWTSSKLQQYHGTITWVGVAPTIVASGICGDNLTWQLDSNDKLTISGSGEMYDYGSAEDVPWSDYAFTMKKLEISADVTAIGDYAFYGFSNMSGVLIPANVESIGAYAFSGWSKLTGITLPAALVRIGEGAFSGDTQLRSVTIPAAVTAVGGNAFAGCTILRTISFCGDAPVIGTNAFANVVADCNYPKGNVTWTDSILQDYGGTLHWVRKSPDAIAFGTCGDHLYWEISPDCQLTIFGSGDMYDYYSSYDTPWWEYLYEITAVIVEEGTTSIGSCAFEYMESLSQISIASSVTDIGMYAFNTCISLTNIQLPDGLTALREGLFYYCWSLQEIMIPASVTTIEHGAFYDCESLTEIVIPDTVLTVESSAFGWCVNLQSVKLSANMTVLPDSIFYNCTSLTEYVIPETITSVGGSAFAYCTGLTQMTIPDTVQTLGYGVFQGCSNLQSVTVGAQITALPSNIFSACQSLKEVIMRGTITSVGNYAFYGCAALRAITIPTTVTAIGYNAFQNCTSLTAVVIPEGVTAISNYTFRGCKALTSVTIPDRVTSLGNYAFEGCASLTEVILGSGLKTIGTYTFQNCKALVSITIPDRVTSLGNYSFDGCTALGTVNLGSAVNTIGSYAFSNCSALQRIMIPASITSISSNAFRGCTGLTEIIFTGNAPTMGSNMFYGVTADAFYPCSNSTWTDGKCLNYGGTITWKQAHGYDSAMTAPNCTQPGYITYTCVCGESYVEDLPALGHTEGTPVVENETADGYDSVVYCTVCGEELSREHFEASAYIPGDINGDGKVNNRDAARLLQYLAGWDVEVVEEALDANGDGKVNNRDAARILQYLAGWDVELN